MGNVLGVLGGIRLGTFTIEREALLQDACAQAPVVPFLVEITRNASLRERWRGMLVATLYPEGFVDNAKPSGKSVCGMKEIEEWYGAILNLQHSQQPYFLQVKGSA